MNRDNNIVKNLDPDTRMYALYTKTANYVLLLLTNLNLSSGVIPSLCERAIYCKAVHIL